MFRPLRNLVERFPSLALAYRTVRDRRALDRRQPHDTAYGFRLMGHEGMEQGRFEAHEVSVVRTLLRHVDVMVDVGANVGLYTCLARQAAVPVIAVEPLQQNLALLYRNLQANGWRDGFEIFPVGLASGSGLATLYGASTGASLLRGWAGASPLMQQIVPLSTLDRLLAARMTGGRALVKIDVEGAEYDVLCGASATLDASPRPIWLVEINLTENHPTANPHFRSTFDVYWSRGYSGWRIGSSLIPVTASDVEQWCAHPEQGPATGNYLFAEPGWLASIGLVV